MDLDNLDSPIFDLLLDAITGPLDEREIADYSMLPWREPIGITAGPVTISFFLRLVQPARDLAKALTLGPAIEQYVAPVLRVPPGERCPVRVSAAGAYLVIEIPRPDPWNPTLAELEEKAAETLLLGFNQRGLPVHLDLYGLRSGALVVGVPGAGKTNAMLSITLQALQRGWELALIDLKGGDDWADLSPWASWGVAFNDGDAGDVLARLAEEVDARNAPGGTKEPPILLIFDELPDASPANHRALATIARKGRSANVRVIGGAQRLGKDVPQMTRASLPNRLVGLCATDYESKEATGRDGCGAENLLGNGDMLWCLPSQPEERIKVPLVEPGDIARLLAGVPKASDGPQTTVRGENPHRGPRPGTLAAEIARLEREAREAGDGREVPPAWILSRATRYAMKHGRPPSYDTLREWARAELGKVLSVPRMKDARAVAARLAGLEGDE